jgi:hypothetical protein
MYNNSIAEKLQNPLRLNNLDNNVQQQQVEFAVMNKIQITPLNPNGKKGNQYSLYANRNTERASALH